MKVNNSRKSTVSIMNHSYFGGIILKQNGIEMQIPQEWIMKDGRIKKYALKMWERKLKKSFKENMQKEAV